MLPLPVEEPCLGVQVAVGRQDWVDGATQQLRGQAGPQVVHGGPQIGVAGGRHCQQGAAEQCVDQVRDQLQGGSLLEPHIHLDRTTMLLSHPTH